MSTSDSKQSTHLIGLSNLFEFLSASYIYCAMDFVIKLFLLVVCAWLVHARIIELRQPRLSLAESRSNNYYFTDVDGFPGTYSFGYDVTDDINNNNQFRTEERYPNGTVAGSYGYVDTNGRLQKYQYVADEKGYRVRRITPRPPTVQKPQKVQIPTNSVIQSDQELTWSRKKNSSKNKHQNWQTWQSAKGSQRQPIKQQYNRDQRPLYYPYS